MIFDYTDNDGIIKTRNNEALRDCIIFMKDDILLNCIRDRIYINTCFEL